MNCGCNSNQKPKDEQIQSTFRANKLVPQAHTANTVTTVTFTDEQFDLNNEYNGVSIFMPKQDGIYQINATVLFDPTNLNDNYRIEAFIMVDDGINNRAVSTDVKSTFGRASVNLSTIFNLTTGSRVSVLFFATQSGNLTRFTGTLVSSFEAARFPFKVNFPIVPDTTISSSTPINASDIALPKPGEILQ